MSTIVVGAGLAGLTAAIRLAERGQRVDLLTFGLGGLPLGQGTIDVLGYLPAGAERAEQLVDDPFAAFATLAGLRPGHPYAWLTPAEVRAATDWLARLLPDWLMPADGHNQLVATALGAMRPTYLVPGSLVLPDRTGTWAIAGPRQLKDFYPGWCAENLALTAGVATKGYQFDLAARAGEVDSTPTQYARSLADPAYLDRFAAAVKAVIADESAVGLPACLGLTDPTTYRQLAAKIGRPVFEIILAPPSIPGLRLNNALTGLAKAAGVHEIIGSKVIGFAADGAHLSAAILRQAGRDQAYPADSFVFAPGGFESGALSVDSHGQVSETVLNLPLTGADQTDLITDDYWADQPLFRVGVATDAAMRPVDASGAAVYDNLRVAGGLLAGASRASEKSGDAIALASAIRAADATATTERN